MYDVVVVGAGVAGLRVACELLRRRPGSRVLVLEREDRVGGRVHTLHHSDGVQMEAGAGRLHSSHARVGALVERYGLATVPIGSGADAQWRPLASPLSVQPAAAVQPQWDALWARLAALGPAALATHTVRQLCRGPEVALLAHHPYTAELDVLRADLALHVFTVGEFAADPPAPGPGRREKRRPASGFYVLPAGASALTEAMAAEAVAAGAEVRTCVRVTDVVVLAPGRMRVMCGRRGDRGGAPIEAARVVLALPVAAAAALPILARLPLLRHLRMEPLLRLYARYGGHAAPLDPPARSSGAAAASGAGGSRGAACPPWFAGLPRTVTDGPLRHVIPVNAATGLIMASYTEGRDTARWFKLRGAALAAALHAAVCATFPDRAPPRPLWVRRAWWPAGCTYWLPGEYDVAAASAAALQPLPEAAPGLHLCGESYSLRQAWVEGALEHADALVERLFGAEA